jgi:hypothetical protein
MVREHAAERPDPESLLDEFAQYVERVVDAGDVAVGEGG